MLKSLEMPTLFKKSFKKQFALVVWLAAIFGFLLCSSHFVLAHHNSTAWTASSLTSKESSEKELKECVDKYTHFHSNKECDTGDISLSDYKFWLSKDFLVQNTNWYFLNSQIKSYDKGSIYILHSVLQV